MYFVLHYAVKMPLCPGDINKGSFLMKGTEDGSEASSQEAYRLPLASEESALSQLQGGKKDADTNA